MVCRHERVVPGCPGPQGFLRIDAVKEIEPGLEERAVRRGYSWWVAPFIERQAKFRGGGVGVSFQLHSAALPC